MKEIQLAHGGGGEEMNELLQGLFKVLDNSILRDANDAAIVEFSQNEALNLAQNAEFLGENSQNSTKNSRRATNLSENSLNLCGKFAISTDSFTLSPIFLDSEVNIGKLCVCGSVNDVLMVGAKPEFLSLAFIIEEGLSAAKLDTIVASIKKECDKAGVAVVCGDTKVVPKGKGDEIYINTTAFGRVLRACESKNIRAGLSVLLSGDIGRHGAAVLVQRNALEASVSSDCKCLKDEVLGLLREGIAVVAMRDATRGGLSAVLNEWARQSGRDILVREDKIAVKDEVKGVCELFGFEAFELANEGTFVLCVEKRDEEHALQILCKFNENASVIGEVLESGGSRVILQNAYGAKRFLEAPKGELLPRIC